MKNFRINRIGSVKARKWLPIANSLLGALLVLALVASFAAGSPLFADASARVQGKKARNKHLPSIFAYAYAGSTINQYQVHPSGILQPLLPPFVLGDKDGCVYKLIFGPRYQFAYALNRGVSIYQLRVSADGRLVPLNPPSIPAAVDISDFLITPDGHFCYACDYDHKMILEYKVNPNGSLTPLSPASISTALKPVYLCVDPTSRFLYTSDRFDKSVSQFQISASGQLRPIGPDIAAHGETISFAFAPNHKALYLCNQQPGSVSQFRIEDDGRLSQIGPPLLLNGANEAGSNLVIASQLKAAYVTDLNGHLFQYRINADDRLSSLVSPIETAGSDRIVISPSERFLYVSSYGTQKISQYRINSDGTLVALYPRDVDASPNPEPLAMAPGGRAVYVVNARSNGPTTISQFQITSDGTLAPLSPAKVTTSPAAELITFAALTPPVKSHAASRDLAASHHLATFSRH